MALPLKGLSKQKFTRDMFGIILSSGICEMAEPHEYLMRELWVQTHDSLYEHVG